ncbi:unnamed protein product [Chilo suppressalis]|uniref:Insulin-like domain-containing protein n=1 Tax=Chilo suppressalis TaxID=168631 RepID=A0ABN8B322_CHISP|nr:unnamed protein product [Chilo suppressalis]
MKNQIVFFLIVISVVDLTYGKSSGILLCGRRLSNALAGLCPSGEDIKKQEEDLDAIIDMLETELLSAYVSLNIEEFESNKDYLDLRENVRNFRQKRDLTYGKSSGILLCGRRLSNALAGLCPSGEDIKKQQEDLDAFIDMLETENSLNSDEDLLWNKLIEILRNKKRSSSNELSENVSSIIEEFESNKDYLDLRENVRNFRQKRGIIDECCDQACKLQDLLSYC